MFNTNQQLPMIHMGPWYPGQMGVPGSDVPRGLLSAPNRKVFFVDRLHPNASATADGVDPEEPLNSIQAAVDSPYLSHGDVIVVGPSTLNSTYAGISTYNQRENVVVANTRPAFVRLVGAGGSPLQIVWDALDPALPNLSLKAPGWIIGGFKFHSPALSAAIKLFDTSPVALDQTQYTAILANYFDGAWAGKYGIELTGAPGNVIIKDNWFLEHKQAGGDAYAIRETASGNANSYECILEGNTFMENDNHVRVPYGASIVRGNIFQVGGLIPATLKLDLSGGTVGHNVVTGNLLMGTYSIAGGYKGNIAHPDEWAGNYNAAGQTTIPPA